MSFVFTLSDYPINESLTLNFHYYLQSTRFSAINMSHLYIFNDIMDEVTQILANLPKDQADFVKKSAVWSQSG